MGLKEKIKEQLKKAQMPDIQLSSVFSKKSLEDRNVSLDKMKQGKFISKNKSLIFLIFFGAIVGFFIIPFLIGMYSQYMATVQLASLTNILAISFSFSLLVLGVYSRKGVAEFNGVNFTLITIISLIVVLIDSSRYIIGIVSIIFFILCFVSSIFGKEARAFQNFLNFPLYLLFFCSMSIWLGFSGEDFNLETMIFASIFYSMFGLIILTIFNLIMFIFSGANIQEEAKENA